MSISKKQILKVKENPFRVLGVVANARMKEIQKNISKINSYLSIGKEITLPFDINYLGSINRTDSTINNAKNMLQLDDNKLMHALFWFVNGNEIDNIAIEHFKKGNIDKSIEIWKKQVSKSAISNTNYSAHNNFSTLLISNGEYKKALKLKSELIESSFITEFGKLVCGDNYLVSKSTLLNDFIKIVISEFKEIGKDETEVIELFSDSLQAIQDLVSDRFARTPISSIDKAIEEAEYLIKKGMPEGEFKNRKGGDIGRQLMKKTKKDISQLKKILGDSHFNYILYADKLAMQLEQCGIAYYNAKRDDYDYLNVYKYALKISEGERARSKLSEAIKHTEEIEEQNKCWFCGESKVVDGCEARFQMHKWKKSKLDYGSLLDLNLNDILNQNRRYSYFQNGGLLLGRCKSCYEIHDESIFSKSLRFFSGESKPTIKRADNASLRKHPKVVKKIREGYEPGLPS